MRRALLALVALLVLPLVADAQATVRTRNFVVTAQNQVVAQNMADWAEYYRKAKSVEWLGYEMQPWAEPCPLRIKLTTSSGGGATSFAFDGGRVLGQSMHIEGKYERLRDAVLPHEITHTVFAYRFKRPMPRWCDEGGAVISEDEIEYKRHDQMAREILQTPGRAIPLRRLFTMTEYPRDVMALYAQGFSVSHWLALSGGRTQFLAFMDLGSTRGWDTAVQTYTRYRSVEQLEAAWRTYMGAPARVATAPQQMARTTPAYATPAPAYMGWQQPQFSLQPTVYPFGNCPSGH